MLNTTLLFLSVTRLGNVPSFSIPASKFALSSSFSAFNVFHSTFSFSFQSLIRTSSTMIGDLSFSSNKFSHFLNSPISLESTITNQPIEKGTKITKENCIYTAEYETSKIIIDSCIFEKCHSDSNGGCILADCPSKKIDIYDSTFYSCTTFESAAVLYAGTTERTAGTHFNNNCVINCNTPNHQNYEANSLIYIKSKSTVDDNGVEMVFNVFLNCQPALEEPQIFGPDLFIDAQLAYFEGINSTKEKIESSSVFLKMININKYSTVQFCELNNLKGIYMFELSNINEKLDILNCNFIDILIDDQEINIDYAFLKVNSIEIDGDSSVTFTECYFYKNITKITSVKLVINSGKPPCFNYCTTNQDLICTDGDDMYGNFEKVDTILLLNTIIPPRFDVCNYQLMDDFTPTNEDIDEEETLSGDDDDDDDDGDGDDDDNDEEETSSVKDNEEKIETSSVKDNEEEIETSTMKENETEEREISSNKDDADDSNDPITSKIDGEVEISTSSEIGGDGGGSSNSGNKDKNKNKFGTGEIIGIVIGVLLVVAIIIGLITFLMKKKTTKSTEIDLVSSDEKILIDSEETHRRGRL